MVDIGLDEEHVALRESVRAFATEVVAPQVAGWYEKGTFPVDAVRQMGRMGLFGLSLPEDVGGMGGGLLALGVAIEELARVDSSLAITLEAGVSLGAMPIHRFGSPELKRAWLPRLASGEVLGAFGLTEAAGGTDAGATRTTARLEGGEWVLNGSKAFITNSGTELTAFVIVTAVTGTRPDGRPEISSILVPQGTPGFTVGPSYDKVGWRCSDTHELAFEDCRVPAEHLVGQRGRGFAQFLEILDGGRVAIAALATGLAQGCVDESTRYAVQREAFGRPIGANQAVAFQVADLDARAHTARLAWWHAAGLADSGRPYRREAAIAKLVASEAAMDNARWAVQVHGGYGYTNESAVGRFYRDAKILEIGEGTSEVQRLLIARDLGLPV
ncbi:MAG TPA: acyl-CoA dehydrogenase family protein [Actinomycetes bacterium]|nr:acyl-CoA dehydrogenase family protein [Actinomycetes bacterium]